MWEPDLIVKRSGRPQQTERKRSAGPRFEEAEEKSQKDFTSEERSNESRDRERRDKRPPAHVEVTNERLYVGNLDYETTEADLYDLFNGVGQVRDAEVVCHKYTQRSKGYAFVVMGSVEEAKRAVDVLNNKEFMGRELWVSGAKSPGPNGGAGTTDDDPVEEQKATPEEKSAEPTDPSAGAAAEEPQQSPSPVVTDEVEKVEAIASEKEAEKKVEVSV